MTPIETLEDWNTALGYCGCCEMPSCPVPGKECQSLTVPVCGYSLPEHEDVEANPCLRYTTKTTTTAYSQSITSTSGTVVTTDNVTYNATATARNIPSIVDSAISCFEMFSQNLTFTSEYRVTDDGDLVERQDYTRTDTSPEPSDLLLLPGSTAIYSTYTELGVTEYPPDPPVSTPGSGDGVATFYSEGYNGISIDNSWTYTAPGTFTKTVTITGGGTTETTTWTVVFSGDIEDVIGDMAWADYTDYLGTLCNAVRDCTEITKVRYRWVVPESHSGSYFLITWDVVFFPEGHDATINDPDATPPDPLPEGVTEEEWWADHQVPDPDAPNPSVIEDDKTWEWTGGTRTSSWYEIAAPSSQGETRIVNVRFICYRSPYGQKPQTTGEAYEP